MPRLRFETKVQCSPAAMWEFHGSVEALKLLTPPNIKVSVVGADTAVREGAIHEIKAVRMGLPTFWKVKLTEVIEGRQFRDTAISSPFASWTHLHEFVPDGDGVILRDTVNYEPPLGFLGKIADLIFLRKDLEAMFRHRHRVTQETLEKGSGPALSALKGTQ